MHKLINTHAVNAPMYNGRDEKIEIVEFFALFKDAAGQFTCYKCHFTFSVFSNMEREKMADITFARGVKQNWRRASGIFCVEEKEYRH